MSHTTEPDVIFCEFNHIYDRSLNDKCPYCKQITEQTNRMKRQVSGTSQGLGGRFLDFLRHNRSGDPDATVLTGAGADDDATVYAANAADDDATVMTGLVDDDDVTVLGVSAAVDDDATQLQFPEDDGAVKTAAPTQMTHAQDGFSRTIWDGVEQKTATVTERRISIGSLRSKGSEAAECKSVVLTAACSTLPDQDAVAAPAVKRVIGWLLCTQGKQTYGSSVELKEGVNGLSFDADGVLRILDGEGVCSAFISRDQKNGSFQICAKADANLFVNGRRLEGCSSIEAYAQLQFPHSSYIFYPAVGIGGFEWRQ